MQLNITTDYAIRVLLCLATEGRPMGAAELSSQAKIPKTYVTFIMSKLKKAGFVSARRGQIGGYDLLKDPANITLWDIIEAMELSCQIMCCLEEGYRCDYFDVDVCPIRKVFVDTQSDIERIFHRVTLEDLEKGHP
jgi:Rrf2 family protein